MTPLDRLLARSRPQPQPLLGDLVATYWPEREQLIPSTALVRILGDFGLSAASARMALSRLAAGGRIVRSRSGRRTYYRHTAAGAARIAEVREQVAAFGTRPAGWDGRWWAVAFNIPEEARASRHQVRARLRGLGFRPLYDGVWISPRASAAELERTLQEVDTGRISIFESTAHTEIPVASVFGLDEVGSAYQSYTADFVVFVEKAARLEPRSALVVRTLAWDRWREVVQSDPALPDRLLPVDWPRTGAREVFAALQEGLERPARERIRELVGRSEFHPTNSTRPLRTGFG